ncbi:tail tape measure protein [Sphingomonas sp. BN140010]|uniref:Tail tape measure protein n=1 Tax=Sphingomonas arvum TaxID=2992113 RepID=A0ABT3JIP4_9SPHN|nr:tail tape measure protein [Sphingomonas sp. BN140010]MCW3798625.1 tail tape measure protein [Sphingomonas sp. BN140010]
MDDTVERLVISVRADTATFARDVSKMRGELEGPLANGAARAGRVIEGALTRAVTGGKIGFDDLRRVATAAMADVAQASVRSFLGGQGAGGGGSMPTTLLSGLLGSLAGRAAGGQVTDGRPYLVGERGPEVFVPQQAGRIEHLGGGSRNVQVTMSIVAPAGSEPQAFSRSSRQIAAALRAAVTRQQ